MIRIAILNKDGFYSKLLANKLSSLFPRKIKRITAFESESDVIEQLDQICKYDLVVIGDGICKDYKQLTSILKHTKCVANSKRFHRNKKILDAGAHWIIPKDVIFDALASTGGDPLSEWVKPLTIWFFSKT